MLSSPRWRCSKSPAYSSGWDSDSMMMMTMYMQCGYWLRSHMTMGVGAQTPYSTTSANQAADHDGSYEAIGMKYKLQVWFRIQILRNHSHSQPMVVQGESSVWCRIASEYLVMYIVSVVCWGTFQHLPMAVKHTVGGGRLQSNRWGSIMDSVSVSQWGGGHNKLLLTLPHDSEG